MIHSLAGSTHSTKQDAGSTHWILGQHLQTGSAQLGRMLDPLAVSTHSGSTLTGSMIQQGPHWQGPYIQDPLAVSTHSGSTLTGSTLTGSTNSGFRIHTGSVHAFRIYRQGPHPHLTPPVPVPSPPTPLTSAVSATSGRPAPSTPATQAT